MSTASEALREVVLPARLPKDFVLGDYVVDGWLRDGGMAAIYRAHRIDNATRVALKLQLPSTAHLPEICDRFDREATAMRRVKGAPNVVELFDSGILEDGRRYFIMEWVEGEDLEEKLDFLRNDDVHLPISDACRIGHAIAMGLQSLHDHDLVHRDLKPANVMIGRVEGEDEEIKLVDFGIVAELNRDHAVESGGPAPSEESVMGTSAYMAPEQAAGHPPQPAMDIFALGVVLYEGLTGTCVPPDGWTPETLPPIESHRPGVPSELAQLVRACMSSDASLRPFSAAEVGSQLEKIPARAPVGSESHPAAGEVRPAVESALHIAAKAGAGVERVPVRTGGTTITPLSEIAVLGKALGLPPIQTGETEISLTQEEVLGIAEGAVKGDGSEPLWSERVGSAQTEIEPAKTETAKTETAKTEPAKTEPAKTQQAEHGAPERAPSKQLAAKQDLSVDLAGTIESRSSESVEPASATEDPVRAAGGRSGLVSKDSAGHQELPSSAAVTSGASDRHALVPTPVASVSSREYRLPPTIAGADAHSGVHPLPQQPTPAADARSGVHPLPQQPTPGADAHSGVHPLPQQPTPAGADAHSGVHPLPQQPTPAADAHSGIHQLPQQPTPAADAHSGIHQLPQQPTPATHSSLAHHPAVVAAPFVPLRDSGAEYDPDEDELDARPARRWWLGLVLLVPVIALGAWLVLGTQEQPEHEDSSAEAAVASVHPGTEKAVVDRVHESEIPAASSSDANPAEPAQPDAVDDDDDDEDAADVRRSSTSTNPSRPKGPDKAACKKLRDDAAAAKKQRRWRAVLEATTRRSCWSSSANKTERRRLRVEAHAETANFERCVKEGGKSNDKQTVARVRWCQKKLTRVNKGVNPWQ